MRSYFNFFLPSCSFKRDLTNQLNYNYRSNVFFLGSLSLSLTAFIGIIFVSGQLSYDPDIVYPKPYGGFMLHFEVGDSTSANAFAISTAISFILLWIGTVFLLRGYRKGLGKAIYWIVMSVPLLYFLSRFEPLVLNILSNVSLVNPNLFNIVYVIVVIASMPIGSILFGLSFVQIARKMQHPEVKNYMLISAIGFLLLFVSLQPQTLISAPFPPFGLISISFMGLSSFLVFIGIYFSAISVSEDSKLRQMIRRTIETEVDFIGNIGGAEMEHKISDKIFRVAKNISEKMPELTGVEPSLTKEQIAEYIQEVLNEKKKV